MTPNQAYQAAQNVLVKIDRLKEMKKELDKEYADLMRIAHGDNLHDAHNAAEMQKYDEQRRQVDEYWSEPAKAARAAQQQAEQAREHPILSYDKPNLDARFAEIEQARQRQR